jgi:hypothetical protein
MLRISKLPNAVSLSCRSFLLDINFELLQDLRALPPDKKLEGNLFQCIFLKRLPAAMADGSLTLTTSRRWLHG